VSWFSDYTMMLALCASRESNFLELEVSLLICYSICSLILLPQVKVHTVFSGTE
jgi:hypothetical protein